MLVMTSENTATTMKTITAVVIHWPVDNRGN
jgi:hypothetical protein